MGHHLRTIHRVCDHVRTQPGQAVCTWWVQPPRVIGHGTPVHGSWLHLVAPWCRIFQRTRLRLADVASTAHLQATIEPFMRAWHPPTHPFTGSTTSVAKGMAEVPAMAA
jgi:hypothetical protein